MHICKRMDIYLGMYVCTYQDVLLIQVIGMLQCPPHPVPGVSAADAFPELQRALMQSKRCALTCGLLSDRESTTLPARNHALAVILNDLTITNDLIIAIYLLLELSLSTAFY